MGARLLARRAARVTRWVRTGVAVLLGLATGAAGAVESVFDVPTRPGVFQRLLWDAPAAPRATLVLMAGGHGGLQLAPDGRIGWGRGNFLVRSRQLFVAAGYSVAVLDAPSDRQSPPYLQGFRQTGGHVADLKAVIAWLRARQPGPVWLVGTSRGTQSAAYVATELSPPDGADGLVLTSTILVDPRGRPVTAMPLDRIRVPVLIVHHEQDGCRACPYAGLPGLLDRLTGAPVVERVAFSGGLDRGDPCEAFSHHGFNGIEAEVVGAIADWIDGRR